MLATSTPETIVPVAATAEAAGVPCVTTVCPWEAFYSRPGRQALARGSADLRPLQVGVSLQLGVPDFAAAYLSLWSQIPTNKKVAVMYPNDDDGNAIRAALEPVLKGAGYTIVDPGPTIQTGPTTTYVAYHAVQQARCEIFNTSPSAGLHHLLAAGGAAGVHEVVKIAQIAKTGLFASQVNAVGPLGYTARRAASTRGPTPGRTARRSPA